MPRPLSKRLILPGDVERAGGRLQIFVPRGLESDPTMFCRVPIGDGETCGKPFYPGEERAFQKHCGECAREHLDEIHAASPRALNNGLFDEENWDPEVAAHMREVGQRMLAEGRLTTKPSERAGS
jgi:hypothetical protein